MNSPHRPKNALTLSFQYLKIHQLRDIKSINIKWTYTDINVDINFTTQRQRWSCTHLLLNWRVEWSSSNVTSNWRHNYHGVTNKNMSPAPKNKWFKTFWKKNDSDLKGVVESSFNMRVEQKLIKLHVKALLHIHATCLEIGKTRCMKHYLVQHDVQRTDLCL